MKIYWSLESIPEIRDMHFSYREKIWRKCFKSAFRRWQFWVSATLVILFQIVPWKIGNILFGTSVYKMLWTVANGALFGYLLLVIAINCAIPCIRQEANNYNP